QLQARISNFSRLTVERYAGKTGLVGSEFFEKVTRPLVVENAKLDLAAARFGSAKRGLEKALRIMPDGARAQFYFAEVYRQRNASGDAAEAEARYRAALKLSPEHAEAHRGLGLLCYKARRWAEAKAEFERYLRREPNAPDKEYIRQYIQE